MSAQEAIVFQWVVCGLIFWFVVGWIILIFEIHRAPVAKAERVLYSYQQSEVAE